MNLTYRVVTPDEMSEEAKVLAKAAQDCSRAAQERLWSMGIPVTVLRGNKIIEIAPDRTERVIKIV